MTRNSEESARLREALSQCGVFPDEDDDVGARGGAAKSNNTAPAAKTADSNSGNGAPEDRKGAIRDALDKLFVGADEDDAAPAKKATNNSSAAKSNNTAPAAKLAAAPKSAPASSARDARDPRFQAVFAKAKSAAVESLHLDPHDGELLAWCRVGGRRVELGKLETEEFESFLRDAASGDSLPRRIDGVPFEGCDLTVDVLPAGFEDRYVVRGFSNIVLDSLDAIGLDPEVNTQIREDIGRRRGGLWILGAAPRHGAKTTLRALAVECAQKQQIVVSLISPSSAKNRENLIDVSSIASRSAADGFAEAMRHDPDVLVAGRIQDRRAAARAAGAACAGVRVLCAVNATNAAQAFATFRGFGVENTILEQARPIFAAQRLMPALCLLCREPDATAVDQLRKLGFPESELRASTVYKAVGCDKCVEGLRGRFAAMENLSTLAPSAPASEARAGHGSLASSLFRAVARGRSTVAELIRSMEGCGIPCRTQSS